MALILNIETSTKSTSVALAKDGKLVAIKEEHDVVSHATKLTPFIQDIVKEANVELKDLDAVAVSIGPGSYTGLRIGLSTAKGLCYALNIPLLSISALEAMAYTLRKFNKDKKNYVSVMNSRKNELYLCLIDSSSTIIVKPTAIKVDKTFLQDYNNQDIIIGGTGLEKIKKLDIEGLSFDENIKFSAKNMLIHTNNLFINKKFDNLAFLEPNYLKPFISI